MCACVCVCACVCTDHPASREVVDHLPSLIHADLSHRWEENDTLCVVRYTLRRYIKRPSPTLRSHVTLL